MEIFKIHMLYWVIKNDEDEWCHHNIPVQSRFNVYL